MAISPVNISRISHNLRADLVIGSVQRNQRDVFIEQTRIATGRDWVTPSENPVAAARSLELTRALQQQGQFMVNLRHGDNTLAASDDALSELNSLLIQAQNIASENVSNLTSAAEREAVAEVIVGIRTQLQTVGNRQFNGRYLFAGRDTLTRPFVDALGGIAYVGDIGHLFTRVAEGQSDRINVPGNELFAALSTRIASATDLSPALTPDTRLDDLNGAAGSGIRRGILVFHEVGGAGTFRVDISSADTIGDVAALIEQGAAAAGSSLRASVSDTGLTITPGGAPVAVTDGGTGVVAADLGIFTPAPTSQVIHGADLGARLTRLTPVSALAGGAGIDLTSGLVLSNGANTVTLDLSSAQTMQDILNALQNAGVNILARINDAGTGIDVFNQVSGTPLSISENGGTTATDLGIRTFSADTALVDLNAGRGVFVADGVDDLRITTADGSTVDVNLDGAATIGDVIDAINAAATASTVNLTASLADTGNGIRLVDGTGGSGVFAVTSLNLSQAATDLGLAQPASAAGGEIIGQDRNPVQPTGVLGALLDLETALRRDDTQGIALAGERLDPFIKDVTRVHGVIGARAQAMRTKLAHMEDAASSTQIFLSELQDLDYAEAITRMQSSVTQLQANLQTSGILLNLSLLDFLR